MMKNTNTSIATQKQIASKVCIPVINSDFHSREPSHQYKSFTPKASIRYVHGKISAAESENAKALRMATRYVAK